MKYLITILLFLCIKASATNYYFSTAGSDANAGTNAGAPWLTPAKFTALLGTTASGDSILFNRGNTFLGFSVNASGGQLNFGAYGTGLKPIISGYSNLTTWTNVGTNLWESSCNSGNNLDLVLVNGVTVSAGRSPNYGTYFNVDSKTGPSPFTVTSTGTNAATQSWVGAQIVVRHNEYNLPREWITSHSANTITYPSTNNPNPIDGNNYKFFIQKHPATLDAQNEWYYNPSTFVLRMFSTVNPSTLNVQAATKDWFYNVDYRNGISFSNLKLIGFDSNAIMGRQFIKLKIINDDFEDIGLDGIALDNDSATYVGYNTFNRIGNTGVYSHFSSYSKVEFNVVDSCGLIYGMSLSNNQQRNGICIEVYNNAGRLGDSSYICDNVVSNVGYCGIRFTGPNAQVIHNYVNEYGLIDSDAGGIYTNGDFGLANQRIIANNVITNGHGKHDMTSAPGDRGMPGIYLDDDTGDVDIIDNTIKNATRGGVFLHNAIHINVLRNKIYAGNGEFCIATADDPLGGPVRNIFVNDNDMYSLPGSTLIDLSSVTNDYASEGIFTNNRYARSSMTTPFSAGSAYSLAGWNSTLGFDINSSLMQVNDDSVRMDVNNTTTSKPVLLSNTYSDFKGVGFYNYVQIPALSSLLLYRKTYGTIRTGRPVKIVP